ncbi:unnamed protein product [Brassica oleracea var. botrytis]
MDRISSLPDELLCHVLSFLPTKNAALTSVLSKSWLNLWKLVPNNIHIDDSLFLHPQDGKGEREEMQRSFVDFVDRVLAMQGDSPINNFSLKCISGRVHPDTVNRWICNVLERGVSDLNLFTDFSYEDTEEDGYRLPRELFFSSTLVKLKLRSGVYGLYVLLFSPYQCLRVLISTRSWSCVVRLRILFLLSLCLRSYGWLLWREPYVIVSSAILRKLILHGTGC